MVAPLLLGGLSALGSIAGGVGSILGGLGAASAEEERQDAIRDLLRESSAIRDPLFQILAGIAQQNLTPDVRGSSEFRGQAASLIDELSEQFARARQQVEENFARRGLSGGSLARELARLEEAEAEATAGSLTGLEGQIRQRRDQRVLAALAQALSTPTSQQQEAALLSSLPAVDTGPFGLAGGALSTAGQGLQAGVQGGLIGQLLNQLSQAGQQQQPGLKSLLGLLSSPQFNPGFQQAGGIFNALQGAF